MSMGNLADFDKIMPQGTLNKPSGNDDLTKNRGLVGLGEENGLPEANLGIATRTRIGREGGSFLHSPRGSGLRLVLEANFYQSIEIR
jgi:hypothetical protein